MANEVRIKLTPEQKAKIKSATGKEVSEIRVGSVGNNPAVSGKSPASQEAAPRAAMRQNAARLAAPRAAAKSAAPRAAMKTAAPRAAMKTAAPRAAMKTAAPRASMRSDGSDSN